MPQDLRHLTQSRSGGMRYARLFALGSGGMASVYLALAVGPSGFNRLVVVKQMHQELSQRDESYQMFLAEARLSARLNHPNVVQVSEVVEGPDGVMLVMEYLDGLPLSSLYRAASEPFTLAMRLRVICEVLAGLHYAHELADFHGTPLGIVHRDVSPQNVFVTYDGRIKLLDFGIAKATNSMDQTRSGLIKGRIAYMPAEQLTGKQVDRRSDIYAVGCLLWEAVAGTRLWADRSDREIARNVLTGRVPALSSRVPVHAELDQIVARATAREPDQRYPSAEAMQLDLERHLSKLGVAVAARDIGNMLGQLFSEAREHRQRAIAQGIAELELSAHADGESVPVESASFERLSLHGRSPSAAIPRLFHEGASVSGERRLQIAPGSGSRLPMGSGPLSTHTLESAIESNAKTAPSAAPPRSRRGVWVAFVLSSLVGLGAIGALRWPRSRPAAVSASASAPAPVREAASRAVSATRSLSVEVTPHDARVSIDGQAVPGSPAIVQVPAGSEHVVRIERDGHAAMERRVRSTEDVALNIELAVLPRPEPEVLPAASAPVGGATQREAPRRVARGPSRRFQPRPNAAAVLDPAVAAAPGPSTRSIAASDCDPPFFFEHGIKTYKPGCI